MTTDASLPEIVVVAGIIRDAQGRLCLSRRPEHKHQGGLWEFPGGKVEAGEALGDALARELDEELGLRDLVSTPFMSVEHAYPDLRVVLHFREVRAWSGEPHGREGQPVEWVPLQQVSERSLPAANRPVAAALRLPRELVVLPDGLGSAALLSGLASLDPARQGIYLRHAGEQLRGLAARCHELGLRFWIADDADLARRLDAFGLHLTAPVLMAHTQRPAFEGMISAACHDRAQIQQAVNVGAHMATLSPVRRTASHPGATPLGWPGFQDLVREQPLVFYALGGVAPDDLALAREHGAFGVAGIRAFWPG
ncbi:NUDIX hydrolase [Alcanivorax sp. N3-2A]|nr:NUDIX hydrolase [Alcanivorax sp. N3-2A]